MFFDWLITIWGSEDVIGAVRSSYVRSFCPNNINLERRKAEWVGFWLSCLLFALCTMMRQTLTIVSASSNKRLSLRRAGKGKDWLHHSPPTPSNFRPPHLKKKSKRWKPYDNHRKRCQKPQYGWTTNEMCRVKKEREICIIYIYCRLRFCH